MELGNAFSELNDPDEQERRFRAAGRKRRRGSAARSGHGLHSRAGARHAAHRGRRHRHRPPHHAAHRFAFHPRSHPVPAAAAGSVRIRGAGLPQPADIRQRETNMRFAWLVARRYLRSPYKPAVLRLVTLLSVVGSRRGRGHAGDCAGDEHRISPHDSGPPAGRLRARQPDAARRGRHRGLSRLWPKSLATYAGRAQRCARDLPDRAAFRRAATRAAWW